LISVSKELLLPALERCARVAPSKGEPSFLSHVKLEFEDVLTYSATNLVTSIRGSIDANGGPVSFTVNVRDLLAAAQSVLGDVVKMSLADNGKLAVSGTGNRRFTCKTLTVENFPAITLEDTEWVEVPGDSLREVISRVMFAVGSESDERQNLKCVRIRVLDGILSAAGANGRALGFASDAIESDATITAVIPRSCVGSLLSTDNEKIGISLGLNSVSFRSGPETMIVRTITDIDSFPPIDEVVDQIRTSTTKKAHVSGPSVIESLSAIRRTDSKADVELTFSKGELKIESGSENDGGYAVDTVENTGEDSGSVRLASEYLTGALKGCANVTIGFGVDLDPFSITDGMFTAIIMPLNRNR